MNTDNDDFFTEDTQDANTDYTERLTIFESTMRLAQEQPKKRFELLCCIYTSTKVNIQAHISINDFLDKEKNVYLSGFDNIEEVFTALKILEEKDLVAINRTTEALKESTLGSVSITLAGITEVESGITEM